MSFEEETLLDVNVDKLISAQEEKLKIPWTHSPLKSEAFKCLLKFCVHPKGVGDDPLRLSLCVSSYTKCWCLYLV